MAFTGNKQTAMFHIDEFTQDRCALANVPPERLVKSETKFDGPVEGRKENRSGVMPIWKLCAHCKRGRDKANAPHVRTFEKAPVEPKAKKETKKERVAREAAEAADASEAVPVIEMEEEAPVDLFAEEPTPA